VPCPRCGFTWGLKKGSSWAARSPESRERARAERRRWWATLSPEAREPLLDRIMVGLRRRRGR